MTVGGRSFAASLRDAASDAGLGARGLVRAFLDPAYQSPREKLLAALLAATILACAALLLSDPRARANPGAFAVPALLALVFAAAAVAGWRRGRTLGVRGSSMAALLSGGLGAVAFLLLARESLGVRVAFPWRAAWILSAPALFEWARLAAGASRRPSRAVRAALHGGPLFLWIGIAAVDFIRPGLLGALTRLGPLRPETRDLLLAAGLWELALAVSFARALGAFSARRAIDLRQRAKLLAPAHALGLAAILLAALLRSAGPSAWTAPLLVLAAVPAAILAVQSLPNLLFADRLLGRALLLLGVVPAALLLAYAAVSLGGVPGAILVAGLIVAAPSIAAASGRVAGVIAGRGFRRRMRAIDALPARISGPRPVEDLALAARECLDAAFPGVATALLIEDTPSGSLREAAAEGASRPPLQGDHPLTVFFRAEARSLTRYEVLVEPRFAHARDALLREMDELRAAGLFPCHDGAALRGLLVLGGQVRGGFFSAREIALARRAAAILGEALSRALLVGGAEAHVAGIEAALRETRAELERTKSEAARSAEDLEESTRHVMHAVHELKNRGSEAKQARAQLAGCAGTVLAGEVSARAADRMSVSLEEAAAWLEDARPKGRSGRITEAERRLEEARRCARALAAIAGGDATVPADLAAAVAEASAVLGHGPRGRIRLEAKVDDVPPIAWPRDALLSALLHILMNAEQAIPRSGTIAISAHATAGRSITIADLEAGEAPPGALETEGKRAWASGAPRVEIAIRDDGQGIAPEHLSSLFDPFFTTRMAKPGAAGSLGLGLAAVADALSRHGGSVRVDSTPGDGTAFVLELPTLPRAKGSRASRA